MDEFNLLPKFVDEAASPVAQSVGKTLSSIWNIVFGGIDLYSEKTQLKRNEQLRKFQVELESKVSSIPTENLVEPPLHIVGPTIEASKYYFESEELRSMFSNLITASLNIETVGKAHPSFVEVIKQLSPLDAKNLDRFKNGKSHPIANFKFQLKDSKGYRLFATNVFLENQEVQDLNLNSTSITNLNRLGLIDISFSHWLTDDSNYDKFYDTTLFKKNKDMLSIYQEMNGPTDFDPLFSLLGFDLYEKVDIDKGIVSVTPYGSNFLEVCVL